MDKIPIFVLNEEAEQFILFQQHYDTFLLLLNNGALNQKNGKVVLHFDSNGTLQLIERADVLFSRKIANKKLDINNPVSYN